MFVYVLVADIKNDLKLINNGQVFLTEYFGETLLCLQQMLAELRLTDPLLELAVGGVLELCISRTESLIFDISNPTSLMRVGRISFLMKKSFSYFASTYLLYVFQTSLNSSPNP